MATSIKSINNVSNIPLADGRAYIGKWDSVLEYSTAVILVNSDKNTDLVVYQSPDKSITYTTQYSITGGTPWTKVFNITSPFIYFTLKNTSGANMTYLNFEVIYRTVSVVPPAGAVASSVSIFDSNGNNLNSTSGALDVYLTNTLTIGGTVSVDNFPATQQVSGSVDVNNFPASFEVSNFPATQPVSGSVDVNNFPASFEVSNFPATQPVSGSVDVNGLVFDGNNLQVVSAFLPENISNDNLKVSIQEQAQAVQTTSYSRVGNLIVDGTLNAGNTTTALSLNDYNATNISVFGNVDGAATISVQFSRNNQELNYYTTQYSVVLTGAGDFGFTIPCACSYVRLKRTDAGLSGVNAQIWIEAC